jgi:hypothetical protein
MRIILVLLLFSSLVIAGLDQSYVQTVSRDGSSEIEKTSDLTIFTGELEEDGLQKIDEFCQKSSDCNVNERNITITEEFEHTGYYSLTTEYRIPSIEYKYTLNRIPTDRFSELLGEVLVDAEVMEDAGKPADSIDLTDGKDDARLLRKYGVIITYTINMPAQIYEARAGNVTGNVSGSTVTFYLIIIVMVIVLAALALTFSKSKRRNKK